MHIVSSLSSSRRQAGFSLIELVFVSAVSLGILGAGVLVFKAVGEQRRNSSSFTEVSIGRDNLHNFYLDAADPTSPETRNVWVAPNSGRAIRAAELRQVFFDDIASASAVFALPRAGRSDDSSKKPIRPASLEIGQDSSGFDIDTPNKFLQLLVQNIASAAQVFSTYEGVPTSLAEDQPPPVNASIFVIEPAPNSGTHASVTTISLRAIWEIDLVKATPVSGGQAGVYASVRRYQSGNLTHYYDVFYDYLAYRETFGSSGYKDTAEFGPAFVCFERSQRGTADNSYRIANNHPFYFIWWPDPSARTLRTTSPSVTDLAQNTIADDPRAAYAAHFGQTSLFFVVPMFPNLQ